MSQVVKVHGMRRLGFFSTVAVWLWRWQDVIFAEPKSSAEHKLPAGEHWRRPL